MAEDKKEFGEFEFEDFDHDLQQKIIEEGRDSFKETNPGLHSVLDKYKNHNAD